jgi:hypothetical protein
MLDYLECVSAQECCEFPKDQAGEGRHLSAPLYMGGALGCVCSGVSRSSQPPDPVPRNLDSNVGL